MKFRHLVRFARSRYFTVDYDVYRMSTCIHFSHFSSTTEMDSLLVLNFAFSCGLRGVHIYKELWNPRLNEKVDTIHEENSPHSSKGRSYGSQWWLLIGREQEASDWSRGCHGNQLRVRGDCGHRRTGSHMTGTGSDVTGTGSHVI